MQTIPLARLPGKIDESPDGEIERKRTPKHAEKPQPATPVWTGQEYSRIPPGQYTASAVRVITPQYIRRWQRWSLGICFCPFAEPDAEVTLFLNLGKNMVPKRGSDFFRAWTQANGEAPKKGELMDPCVFLEGHVYEIEIVDADVDSDGNPKSDAEVYSKVKRIVSVQRNQIARLGVVPIRNLGRSGEES
jgi:hypothetical protein